VQSTPFQRNFKISTSAVRSYTVADEQRQKNEHSCGVESCREWEIEVKKAGSGGFWDLLGGPEEVDVLRIGQLGVDTAVVAVCVAGDFVV